LACYLVWHGIIEVYPKENKKEMKTKQMTEDENVQEGDKSSCEVRTTLTTLLIPL